mmetsp:Transcript_51592/g.160070  ORF Transcript_51592/g.160070 Transcript_51592/m.160070 type:complete len:227 (-) Transcript_51592:2439-3119(-)
MDGWQEGGCLESEAAHLLLRLHRLAHVLATGVCAGVEEHHCCLGGVGVRADHCAHGRGVQPSHAITQGHRAGPILLLCPAPNTSRALAVGTTGSRRGQALRHEVHPQLIADLVGIDEILQAPHKALQPSLESSAAVRSLGTAGCFAIVPGSHVAQETHRQTCPEVDALASGTPEGGQQGLLQEVTPRRLLVGGDREVVAEAPRPFGALAALALCDTVVDSATRKVE